MFERYSERARRAVFFARDEALRRKADAIDTCDLVLGLTRDKHKEGCPFAFLHDRADDFRLLLGANVLGTEGPVARDIPLTPKAKIALRNAAKEADRYRSSSIDAEHLFCGVLMTDDATARKLAGAGWTLSAARESVRLIQLSSPKIKRHWIPKYRSWLRRGLIALAVIAIWAAILYKH